MRTNGAYAHKNGAKTTKKKILTHDEVLVILSEQAQEGSVTAAAALERALRARAKQEETSFEDELAALTK